MQIVGMIKAISEIKAKTKTSRLMRLAVGIWLLISFCWFCLMLYVTILNKDSSIILIAILYFFIGNFILLLSFWFKGTGKAISEIKAKTKTSRLMRLAVGIWLLASLSYFIFFLWMEKSDDTALMLIGSYFLGVFYYCIGNLILISFYRLFSWVIGSKN